MKSEIKGIVHCSGGAQTKCLRFGQGVHFIKNNLMPVPAVFSAIQKASGTTMKEMYKVFNMGHRMELYIDKSIASSIINISKSFNVDAKIIGRVEAFSGKRVSINSEFGEFIY